MSDYQQLATQVQNLVATNTTLVTEVTRVRDATMGIVNLYPSIQAGLDNTPDGGYFSVPGLGQFLTLYRRNGSVQQTIAQYPTLASIQAVYDTKVDKVIGKQLSTEDFTTALLNKLSAIEPEATKVLMGKGDTEVPTNQDLRESYKVEPRVSVPASISLDFSDEEYKLIEEGIQTGMPLEDILTVTNGAATRVNHLGQIVPTAPNTPRIDWTSGKPQLLVEEQRTNLLTWSEDFSNAVYTQVTGTYKNITSVASPIAGTDFFESDGQIQQSGLSATGNVVLSLFVKKAVLDQIDLQIIGSDFANRLQTTFNFSTETFSTTVALGLFTGVSAKITEKLSNGVYRIEVSGNTGSTPATRVRFGRDGVCYFTGAQLEAASTPSSYIPTQASAVTRLADNMSRVLGEEFNSGEGTFYVDAEKIGGGSFPRVFEFYSLSNERLLIYRSGSTSTINTNYTARVQNADGFVDKTMPSNTKKFLVKWSNGVCDFYADGVSIGQSVVSRTPVLTNLSLLSGQGVANTSISALKDTKYYPKALSESECIELTKV